MPTQDQIVWTMITNLLCTIYTYYIPSNVFYAFQNNYTLPQVDEFIILTRRNLGQSAYPWRQFDATNQNEVYTAFGDWEYQVDLYGDNSDISADILHTYLYSDAASNYLYLYPLDMGIGKLDIPRNLTKQNDRDRYMKRYTLTFTLLNISSINLPTAGINDSNIQVNIIQEVI
jgi:hypothetical protein